MGSLQKEEPPLIRCLVLHLSLRDLSLARLCHIAKILLARQTGRIGAEAGQGPGRRMLPSCAPCRAALRPGQRSSA